MKNPKLNPDGSEIHNEPPLAIPAHFRRPPTLAEQIQHYTRQHLSRLAQEQGLETFEEAEDFDVGDDYDPSSPHELHFDPLLGKEIPLEQKIELDRARQQFDQAAAEARKKKPVKENKKAPKEPPKSDEDED